VKKHQRRRPPPKQRRAVAPGLMLIDELRQLDDGKRFWHGGAPGLAPGNYILPASETGSSAATDKVLAAEAMGEIPYSQDVVYITNNLELALIFAGRYKGGFGDVYEVSPVGQIERDPDDRHGCFSYLCERARIVRRVLVHPRVLRTIRGVLRLTPDGRSLQM
jgi:hypothetical protein